MLRLLVTILFELVANAIGLLIANWLLPGFQMTASGFVIVLVIFTIAKFILGPLLFKMTFQYMRALNGGVALVTTFVGLLITTFLTNGLVITGIDGWVLGTLIVWLCGVLAILILPLFLFKKVMSGVQASRPTNLPPIQ
jgi:hypothetical protein